MMANIKEASTVVAHLSRKSVDSQTAKLKKANVIYHERLATGKINLHGICHL